MKVNERALDADLLCQDSLNLLSQKIRAFFNREFPNSELWFPDDTTQWNLNKKKTQQVHIILYGNLLRSLAEIPFWPGENVFIWVLSEASKASLLEILGLKSNQVSVLPRSIFTTNESVQHKFSRELVYAGRISRQKNILDLIFTLYFLQHEHSADYQLKLIGAFDDEYNQDLGRMIFNKTFENELMLLISKLSWKKSPQFEGKKEALDWPKLLSEKNTLISLSRFIMEDFGVSLAQAQELGLSTISSEWGGLKDIQGPNHLHINTHLLSHECTPLGLRIYNTRKIAQIIANAKGNDSRASSLSRKPKPEILSRAELDLAHQFFTQKAGPAGVLLSRDQLAPYADTAEGKALLNSIGKNYESSYQKSIVLIISKQSSIQLKENQQIFCAYQSHEYVNSKTIILEETQVTQKWALALIVKADEVLATGEALTLNPKLLEYLRSIRSQVSILEKVAPLPLNLDKIIAIEK